MELMDLFRKQSRETALKEKIRQGFDDSVMEVIREGAAESPMGGINCQNSYCQLLSKNEVQ